MRCFNTSGPIEPEIHFYIKREEKLNEVIRQIKGQYLPSKDMYLGCYFTLFAPRQMGKTTFVKDIERKLDSDYIVIRISFEGMIGLSENQFYEAFHQELCISLKNKGFEIDYPVFHNHLGFINFNRYLAEKIDKKFVLIIDEFDAIKEDYIGNLLHSFRKIYIERDREFNLHSLILVGIQNITGINLDHASPFNTNDIINLEKFTKKEVFDLIGQYEEAKNQRFVKEVKERIFYETKGQPGLTNALCKYLVEDFNPGLDCDIKINDFNKMYNFFIFQLIDKNTRNIMNKASNYKDQLLQLFDTSKKTPYNVDEEWQEYFIVNGIIEPEQIIDGDNIRSYVRFTCPLYQKKLYNKFKPVRTGEETYYFPIDIDVSVFLDNQRLNIQNILKNYQSYVNRRGKKAFEYAKERKDGSKVEAVYHYSLDSYLSNFMDVVNGICVAEFPTGNGKVDLWLKYKDQRYVIEVKNYLNPFQVNEAKKQAVRYAKSEGLKEAYLVIFTKVHPKNDLEVSFEEEIDDIKLFGIYINVNFNEG
ncbi:MAG: AAA-like domain-containing protein [Halanaerobiales bacterium]|nr:AAA-like domain-containing protein [Halanaerobiales bacterium]